MGEKDVAAFIERWRRSGGAERANYALFLTELCDVLGVPRPHPAGSDETSNHYRFERPVTFHNPDGTTSPGRIDLYRRGSFVLEAKQGVDAPAAETLPLFGGSAQPRPAAARRGSKGWDNAMLRARGQAEAYAKALPVEEGWPPFLIIVDVGHSIELFADFARTGKHYTQFPDAAGFRIKLEQLVDETIRERLRAVWLDPLSLDPAKRAAKVTREIAAHLAILARELEKEGHAPERVAMFLMRCLFTLFAEDVGLLPNQSFLGIVRESLDHPETFVPMVREVWQRMNDGGFSTALHADVLRFNGRLFENADVLPLRKELLGILIEAAKADWRDVEPAIFGTLLERALDPVERHRLGAHYTPRAYVERLVMPTVIEPLREDWENVRTAAVARANAGDTPAALTEVKTFHRRLCEVRVLDPACGSGNFLYVTMEHMKRLEGEVVELLRDFGETQDGLAMQGYTVDPHQFLGLEVNPRAAAITDLVLWIGYLQWHFRTRGKTMPAEPVLKNFQNIECRDAVLAWDKIEIVRDAAGKPVSRWDGRTYKKHPVTGEDVPDETARIEQQRYVNPRPTEWPAADFIVGNPPYIGGKDIRREFGDGYVEALWRCHPRVPNSVDFVMYWWDKASTLVRGAKARRFGFITTNSLPQTFSRRVVEAHLASKPPLSLVFAIPDHPWVDSADGADVRVAMTVGAAGLLEGHLRRVIEEGEGDGEGHSVRLQNRTGRIHANLRVGVDVTLAVPLRANEQLCSPGVKLHGAGFIVTPQKAEYLGLGRVPGVENHIRPYLNGRDLVGATRGVMVIDLYGLTAHEVAERYPDVFQWILNRVKPERDHNNRRSYKESWWIFGEPRSELRESLHSLCRYIATVETAKHRTFIFLSADTLADNRLICISTEDGYILGILCSKIHVTWTLASGGLLEDRPIYTKTRCFDPFPFPDCNEEVKARIRDLGERLDRHRKDRRAAHPEVTLTQMYNVLEKLRAGAMLLPKDREIHEKGLVSLLKEIHDDLDAAVFDAYGWPVKLTDEGILERLVALNRERAAEEATGHVRWLRPEFQAPREARPIQAEMPIAAAPAAAAAAAKQAWPKALPEQVRLVREALAARPTAATPDDLARDFRRARKDQVAALLATLAELGHIRAVGDGRFVAAG